jgi:hypothetical protein
LLQALGRIVESILIEGIRSSDVYIRLLNPNRLRNYTNRFGVERVEETCDSLEACQRAIADNDMEGALACAERAKARWATK